MRAFEVLCSFPNGISASDLAIDCRSENDRKPSTAEREDEIESIWEERRKSNQSLFNGTKFRFHSVEKISTSQKANSAAVLRIGITDYKSFLGTNCSLNWKKLDPSQLASPLGNAAIVETKDKMIVLLKRSANVGECPHTIVMPGGHSEPETLGIKSLEEWKKSSEPVVKDIVKWKKDILIELFDSMIREIVEETGIPNDKLMELKCIGFSRRVQNHRPDIVFHVCCNLTSEEVQQFYAAGPEHKSESTELILMQCTELIKKVIHDDAVNMPGCHRGAVDLFRQYMEK